MVIVSPVSQVFENVFCAAKEGRKIFNFENSAFIDEAIKNLRDNCCQ